MESRVAVLILTVGELAACFILSASWGGRRRLVPSKLAEELVTGNCSLSWLGSLNHPLRARLGIGW